jgi:hypothetical protein
MIVNRSINTQGEILEPPEIDDYATCPNDEPDKTGKGRSACGT